MSVVGIDRDFAKLTCTWKQYFKFLGVDFDHSRITIEMRFLNITTFILLTVYIYQLIIFIIYSDIEVSEKSQYISSLSFSLASLGRLLTFVIAKKRLMHCVERFRNIYPSKRCKQRYNLQHFSSQYRRVELFLLSFNHSIMLAYWLLPILVAFVRFLFAAKKFEFPLLLDFYYPFEVNESWLVFMFAYTIQALDGYALAFIILSCDLCLFSLLIQLCMHFDIIAKKISELDATEENAEQNLKKQISYHQEVLDLCDDVNSIFSPSLTLSLLFSCFILCFSGFQLLDDMPIQTVIITLFMLCYEFKQVVITCYYGEKLMENSERLFYELYNHNWADGSNRYKKLVLFAMCRTRYPSALNVAKVSDLNLRTLRFVLSNAYQAFTVLKTTK